MPILPREPDLFPENLLADMPAAASGPWWLLYSLSRQEKELVRRLRVQGVPHYCPIVRRQLRSPAGRLRYSFVPLFAGYVFLQGGDEERSVALQNSALESAFGRSAGDVPPSEDNTANKAPFAAELASAGGSWAAFFDVDAFISKGTLLAALLPGHALSASCGSP